jgi:hypothetical protein
MCHHCDRNEYYVSIWKSLLHFELSCISSHFYRIHTLWNYPWPYPSWIYMLIQFETTALMNMATICQDVRNVWKTWKYSVVLDEREWWRSLTKDNVSLCCASKIRQWTKNEPPLRGRTMLPILLKIIFPHHVVERLVINHLAGDW